MDSLNVLTRNGRILLHGAPPVAVMFFFTLLRIPGVTAQTPSTGQGQLESSNRRQIDVAYERGVQLLNEKRYQEAVEQFRWVEDQSPQSPQGPSGRGIALALLGKPQEAIQALKNAIALDPSYWVAHRELGIVYWSQGFKDDAARELEPIIDLHPNDSAVNVILGQYAFEHKNYSQTVTYLSRVPGHVSADPGLSLVEAEAQLKTGQTAQAVERLTVLVGRRGLTPEQTLKLAWQLGEAKLFKAAIQEFSQVSSDYPDALGRNYGLALAYFEDAQYEKCVTTLQELVAKGSATPELFALLGVAEEKNGQTKEAYDAFRQGIVKNPKDVRNYLNIATLSCKHMNYGLAAQILTSGIEQNPQAYELFLSRGIAYTLKGQFALAQQDYERAIQMSPDDPGNYIALGISQLEVGDLDGAIKALINAVRRGPKDPRAYYFLTEALMQKGVSPGSETCKLARRAIDTAISLDPDFAFAFLDRAKLEFQVSEADPAIADLERARALDPRSSSIAYLLAQAYRRKGQKAKADELFGQVKQSSEQEAREFRRNSLTQAIVGLSYPTQ